MKIPLLQLPAGVLPALHRVLAEDRSPEEAALLIRRIGFEAGEGFTAALEQRMSGESGSAPASRFWQELNAFFEELGWGTLRQEALHPGVTALSSDGWMEADGQDGSAGGCSLTTGILADLLSRVAGTDLAVLEVECRSRGGERCRWLVGSEAALQEVYSVLREGGTHQEAVAALR